MRDGGKSEDIQHTHHSQMIKQLENIHRHESNCKYDIAIFFVRCGRDFLVDELSYPFCLVLTCRSGLESEGKDEK